MKKYISVRLIVLVVNIAIIFTVVFFALNYAQYAKYSDMPFSAYFERTVATYKLYLRTIFQYGDWGFTSRGKPIVEILVTPIMNSFKLNVIAFCVYFPLGILIGTVAAIKRDKLFDRIVTIVFSIFGSIPIYIMMFLIIFFLGYKLGIGHYQYVESYGWRNNILPVIALSILPIGMIQRIVRSELIENMTSEHILLARSKGLTYTQAVVRHSLRNSIIPVITKIPDAFLHALVGSFFVELVYNYDGVANHLYDALVSLSPMGTWYVNIDIYTTMVVILFYTILSLSLNLASDILLVVADPRIKLGVSK